MVAKILGWIFIVVGVGWPVFVWLAAAQAARAVDTWKEVVKPSLFGFIPIMLGVALVLGL